MQTLKANDTFPPLRVALTQTDDAGNDIPLDLTGCDVKFIMRRAGIPGVISRSATVEDEAVGRVRVEWEAADTNVTRTTDCQVQFEVTRSDLRKFTVPNTGFIGLRIEADLDGA